MNGLWPIFAGILIVLVFICLARWLADRMEERDELKKHRRFVRQNQHSNDNGRWRDE